ncbi:DUF2924 domain-containing protein [Candidatus Avelusimicrobium alvi]|uniref:DUF2924 domain-containing protein n=1 Tax=Candidatus Avelusimicrobium alvi TaxID=3416221 RepID=UPI003D0C85B8
MKKTTKKSVPTNKSIQTVLRVINPTTTEDTSLENLPIRPRDNRLPAVGTVITKTYHGKTIEVKVLEDGFEYQGKIYKSISRVAMDIVKRPISGYVFFGLSK